MKMRFHTHNEGPVNIHLTQLKGTIQARLSELTGAFGKPASVSSRKGVHFHWSLCFQDGTVATVYNWNSASEPEQDEMTTWHIGSHSLHGKQLAHAVYRNYIGVGVSHAA